MLGYDCHQGAGQNCPDLDEDDDGIPDYVELGNAVVLQDADGDGTPTGMTSTIPAVLTTTQMA